MSNMYFDEVAENAQVCADTAASLWEGLDGNMNSGVDWTTEANVAELNPATGALLNIVTTDPTGGTGSGSGDMGARAAQVLIEWHTGVFAGGREIRGKTFVPGIVQSASAGDGSVDSTLVTALAAFVGTWLVEPGNATPGVWSRKNGVIHPIATGAVANQFAVLRSRRD